MWCRVKFKRNKNVKIYFSLYLSYYVPISLSFGNNNKIFSYFFAFLRSTKKQVWDGIHLKSIKNNTYT